MSERWHGTTGGYTHHGCRCGRCLIAMRDYHRRWRNARGHLLERGSDSYRAEVPVTVAPTLNLQDRIALANLVSFNGIPLVAEIGVRLKREQCKRDQNVVKARQHLARLDADGFQADHEPELVDLIAAQADDDRFGNSLRLDHDWFQVGRLDDSLPGKRTKSGLKWLDVIEDCANN